MKSAAKFIIVISVLFWAVFIYNFFAGLPPKATPAQANAMTKG